MSVTFSVDMRPTGYRISCAFASEVYPTSEMAATAAQAHPQGGCLESISFTTRWGDESDSDYWARCSAFIAAHPRGDNPDDCQVGVWSIPAYAEEAPILNVSNQNARLILDVLGFGTGQRLDLEAMAEARDGVEAMAGMGMTETVCLVGQTTADDLLGRCLVGIAAAPEDPGVPSYDAKGSGGASFIECGREPGYLQDRLDKVREIAEWAAARGLSVSWS